MELSLTLDYIKQGQRLDNSNDTRTKQDITRYKLVYARERRVKLTFDNVRRKTGHCRSQQSRRHKHVDIHTHKHR